MTSDARVQGVAVEPEVRGAPADSPDASNTELEALRQQIAELKHELDVVRQTLADANGICRSAYQIAVRIVDEYGDTCVKTNFSAFRDRAKESLERQQSVLYPQGDGDGMA